MIEWSGIYHQRRTVLVRRRVLKELVYCFCNCLLQQWERFLLRWFASAGACSKCRDQTSHPNATASHRGPPPSRLRSCPVERHLVIDATSRQKQSAQNESASPTSPPPPPLEVHPQAQILSVPVSPPQRYPISCEIESTKYAKCWWKTPSHASGIRRQQGDHLSASPRDRYAPRRHSHR